MARTSKPYDGLRALEDARTIRLETQKRDGSWVATPVSLAHADGRLYFRTYDRAGKAKRLRNFAGVRATPCSLLGKVRAPATPVAGRARLLDGDEALTARRLLARQFPVLHGVAVPTAHRLKGWTTLHYELRLDA